MTEEEKKKRKVKANRISTLRKKVEAGKANYLERAEVQAWDASKAKNGRKPKSSSGGTPSQPAETSQDAPQARQEPPQVFSSLPGGSGVDSSQLPPLNVPPGPVPGVGDASNASGAGGPQTSQSIPPNGSGDPSVSSASTSSKKMAPEAARANGEMLADMATKVLSEFNEFNRAHNGPALGKEILSIFHFSVARLATKYASDVDEDTYDTAVVVGMGGYVGYNSYRIHKRLKKEEKQPNVKREEQPAARQAPTAQSDNVRPFGPPPPVATVDDHGLPKLEGSRGGVFENDNGSGGYY